MLPLPKGRGSMLQLVKKVLRTSLTALQPPHFLRIRISQKISLRSANAPDTQAFCWRLLRQGGQGVLPPFCPLRGHFPRRGNLPLALPRDSVVLLLPLLVFRQSPAARPMPGCFSEPAEKSAAVLDPEGKNRYYKMQYQEKSNARLSVWAAMKAWRKYGKTPAE